MRLALAGDTMLGRLLAERLEADPDKPFCFRAPPHAVEVLTDLGVDCVTLANNHALDDGVDAFLDTIEHLTDAERDWIVQRFRQACASLGTATSVLDDRIVVEWGDMADGDMAGGR